MSTIEQEELDGASHDLEKSELDKLTKFAMKRSLRVSSDAIDPKGSEDPIKALAQAHATLAIAISQFMIGSRQYAVEIAMKAVSEHIQQCNGRVQGVSNMTWGTVFKQMALKSPYAFAFIAGVAILKGSFSQLIPLITK